MKTCITEGCDRRAYAQDRCQPCYYRARRSGEIVIISPHAVTRRMGKMPIAPEKRFMALVDKSGPIQPTMTTACWLWIGWRRTKQANRTGGDYGQFYFDAERGRMPASRASFLLFVGPLADDEDACHFCDFPPCVRPDHLFSGTRAVNMADAMAKGRIRLGGRREKITEAQVQEIRARAAAGEFHRVIGESLGITGSHVSRIVKEVTGNPCSTPDCDRKAVAKGMCAKCYGRAKRIVVPS